MQWLIREGRDFAFSYINEYLSKPDHACRCLALKPEEVSALGREILPITCSVRPDVRCEDGLTVLEAITKIEDIPQTLFAAWSIHLLHGNLKHHYGLSVSGNWRMTFRITDAGNVELLDYVDYH